MRSNAYLNKEKHSEIGKSDSGIVRHRHMLRCNIIYLCNTGLRVGEARHLRWYDVSFTENRLGGHVIMIGLGQTLSTLRKAAPVMQRW
jgi:hypothetical protein